MNKKPMWLLALGLALSAAYGAAFTYQGRLLDGGRPANGSYDLQFALSGAPAGTKALGPTLVVAPVPVSNGLFTVALDFGSGVFDGSARWLEIGVRTNGSADDYTLLSPRQPITATPYALFAETAGSASTGSGTNLTIYGGLFLAGPTNVVLYATNQTVVTTPPNTNVIMVSGAGVDAANGTYTLQDVSPNLIYSNANGMALANLPDDSDYAWQIISPAGAVLYGSWADDLREVNGWQVLGGTGPRPSAVSYGVNVVTNSVMQLGLVGAKVPGPALGNDLYVNGAIGNDLFAQRGRPDLPFQTVYAALSAATNDDTVWVAAGVYNEKPFRIYMPRGIKIRGAGKRVTAVYGHPAYTGDAAFQLTSSNVLSSFTTDFVIGLGGYPGAGSGYGATNVLLENLEATGVGDVVYGTMWQGLRAFDCEFTSQSDCFADAQTDDSGTNAVAELYNCRLFGGWHGIANFGRGQIRMFGGSIEARTSGSGACVFGWDAGRPGATIELSGVSLRHSAISPDGTAYAIHNQSGGNCVITVKGMLVDPAWVSGPVNFEGFGLTTNVPVLGPGSVTNTLCFTNGVLMDVK